MKGQNTAGDQRSKSRENITVVATVSAAGVCVPPSILFSGKRLNLTRVKVADPEGSV